MLLARRKSFSSRCNMKVQLDQEDLRPLIREVVAEVLATCDWLPSRIALIEAQTAGLCRINELHTAVQNGRSSFRGQRHKLRGLRGIWGKIAPEPSSNDAPNSNFFKFVFRATSQPAVDFRVIAVRVCPF
jgi:hypothetical protein